MENEYVEPASVKKVAMKWGLILGLITVALGMVWQLAGLAGQSWTGWVNLVPLSVVIYLAHKEFKDTGDNFMSYGQGLGIGMLVSLISGVIGAVFSYIYLSFIDDSMIQQLIDQSYETWEAQGLTDAQIAQGEKFNEFLMTPGVLSISSVIVVVFSGFIVSLIVSAITRNSRPEFA